VTIDDGDGSSAISVVTRIPLKTGGDFIVRHEVLLVGRARVEDMASNLMANLDQAVGEIRAALKANTPAPTATEH
jgi:hypothetical protein